MLNSGLRTMKKEGRRQYRCVSKTTFMRSQLGINARVHEITERISIAGRAAQQRRRLGTRRFQILRRQFGAGTIVERLAALQNPSLKLFRKAAGRLSETPFEK